MLDPWKKNYDQPRQHAKKQSHYFADKGPYSQSYGFSNSHVWMWVLGHKENWPPKNWWFWTVVLKKSLEGPLDCKETRPVNPKGNQSWIFIGRTDGEAEAPTFWPPDAKLATGKDHDAGKDWRQEEKGMTDDQMVGWHHWLSGHEFEQPLGVSDRQGSLACCSPWGCRVRHDWVIELICLIRLSFEQYQKYWGFYGRKLANLCGGAKCLRDVFNLKLWIVLNFQSFSLSFYLFILSFFYIYHFWLCWVFITAWAFL